MSAMSLGDLGSIIAGSVVVGIVLAFVGPFLIIISVVASLIYGPVIMFLILAAKVKEDKESLKDWG